MSKTENFQDKKKIKLITLDPGHFHAALVQKSMIDNIDSVVHVYAPPGPDLDLHLKRIESFNTRSEDPTNWEEVVYRGNDFLQKMTSDKSGNVVVISGNNRRKTSYINASLKTGFHVLADKPMAINTTDFHELTKAFKTADDKNLLLYDIMTERFEIATILQREISMIPEIFGALEKGTPESPAVTKESVHHFYKNVAGNTLVRPAWFFDTEQQGEGIVDVTTHLVDLVQWECFPEQIIDYQTDVKLTGARRWPTNITRSEFKSVTQIDQFPNFLNKSLVNDSTIAVYGNGEINYLIKGVHAKVSVTWAFKAPEGGGDTHYSVMRGTKSNLIITQGAETAFRPTLTIEPIREEKNFENIVLEHIKKVQSRFPGITLEKTKSGWQLVIPDEYHVGHEAHFGQVLKKYLEYIENKNMPSWEVPNMITKYYITTQALEMAKGENESKR